jgi:hypothetical protein
VTGQAAAALKEAATPEDAVAALERKVSFAATPRVVPAGAMVLQPSDERRRSGSHYTPRTLTEPIVETTFRPILERLSPNPTPDQILDLKVCDPAMGSGAFLVAVCRLLADLLVRAWHAHNLVPKDIPPDEDETLHARRIVAQRCLYGVDKNPMAVDLAKLSLWLATLAKDHPFTFLDHALKCGDSLVGLSKAQILGFHWKPEKQRDFARAAIEGQLGRALDQRRQIREAPDSTSEALLRERLTAADGFTDPGRRYGDLVVSAFFAADNDRKRKERLESLSEDLAAQRSQFDVARHQRLDAAVGELRGGSHPVVPFHWEIEFPEVFDRENPGFDAFVGNPPFLGGLRISNLLGMQYFSFLTESYPPAGHLCDLVAYFFRRAFDLLRKEGVLGLVATNSIAQGDTRGGGLSWICTNGGSIISATRRLKWPGDAAVIVSVVHIFKDHYGSSPVLDGHPVERITAFLFTRGGDLDPDRLPSMNPLFSQGTNIRSPGFLIGHDGEATNTEEMRRLLAAHAECADRILPYLGGEEINSSPTLSSKRFVIFLSDIRSETELSQWRPLEEIVRAKVKPERDALGNNPNNIRLRREWWAYHADRRDFYEEIRKRGGVLVGSQVSSHFAFALQPSNRIYGNTLNLFLLSNYPGFAVMQSRPHEVWGRFFASSMKDDMRYTPSDCFETFPFPKQFETNPILESAGRTYYDFRADLMVRKNEGMTKTYNRFHDPDERSPDILKLRELHAAMDRAVLDAYGWTDLKPTCEFLLDYEEEEDEEESGGGRRRKKPWRYRWPDDFRDEVLARLLELNRQRAEEERLSGAAAEAGRVKVRKKSTAGRKTARKNPDQPEFFES